MAEITFEKTIEEFVKRLRDAAGSNLQSVVLHGSAVAGDYHPRFSNLNVLCLVRESSFAALKALSPAAVWWNRQKQPPPLILTRLELERSLDVFAIEMIDIKAHHRILFGEDVLQDAVIPREMHRRQLEYELREKTILLRENLMLAADEEAKLWNLLLHSVSSFITLFRHALLILEGTDINGKQAVLSGLAQKLSFDPAAFQQVLSVREEETNRKKVDVQALCGDYLAIVEKVTAAVDQALDSNIAP